MRIDFFLTQHGAGKEHCSSLLSFLEAAGHSVLPHDISCVADDETADRNADIVICYAIGGRQGKVKDRALAAGKPVVVMELGYLGSRYQNIGVSVLVGKDDRLHNNNGLFLAQGKSADDRLIALGISAETHDKAPVGKALLLGQVPGDSQLGGRDIEAWARDMTSTLNQAGYEVTFRPHPGVIAQPQTLTDAMRDHNIAAGFNSTALVEAIRLGVPFVCDERCQYFQASTTDLMKPTALSIEARRQFIANLAYCQHNVQQFGNGEAWAHILRLLEMRGVSYGQGT
jgi:hypothetical protein